MIDQIYEFFAKLGYAHPLHPSLVHGPIGGVIVAFFLGMAAWKWPRRNLLQSAYYVIIITFILYFPTVLAGILDWQHYYDGALILPIKIKMVLAVVFLLLLSIALMAGLNPKTPPWTMNMLYTLCLFNVIGLGYYGGQLVYGGRLPEAGESFSEGRKIFVTRCSGCHANGGNILKPNLPLRTAPQLESYELFLEFIRNPKLPNGRTGPMPALKENELSDQQVRELYNYVIHGFAKPTRSGDR